VPCTVAVNTNVWPVRTVVAVVVKVTEVTVPVCGGVEPEELLLLPQLMNRLQIQVTMITRTTVMPRAHRLVAGKRR
jgi:hypothetical protein